MSPSSPYDTRSPSSTCAGSPEPSRPATYFTSGAYVRISRSRIALSPLWSRYSRQRDWVSSASATAERIRGSSVLPQCSDRHRGEPDGEGRGGDGDDPPRADVARGVGRGECDARHAEREHEEERTERTALLQRAKSLTATILHELRGVAQLVERRSPKP